MTFRYDDGEDAIPQGMMGAVWAFGWGAAAASGVLVGAILGLMTHLRHRAIAAIMSVGAGVLLSVASIEIASEALVPKSLSPLIRLTFLAVWSDYQGSG
jgi:hypothetical protein